MPNRGAWREEGFPRPGMSNWKGGSRCSFDGTCVSTNRGASGKPLIMGGSTGASWDEQV